jgi:hypothetical protein
MEGICPWYDRESSDPGCRSVIQSGCLFVNINIIILLFVLHMISGMGHICQSFLSCLRTRPDEPPEIKNPDHMIMSGFNIFIN